MRKNQTLSWEEWEFITNTIKKLIKDCSLRPGYSPVRGKYNRVLAISKEKKHLKIALNGKTIMKIEKNKLSELLKNQNVVILSDFKKKKET